MYRCYRCTTPMSTNVIPYCNTCRTEEAIKNQTAALKNQSSSSGQLNAQLLAALVQSLQRAEYDRAPIQIDTQNLGLDPIEIKFVELTPEQIAEHNRKYLEELKRFNRIDAIKNFFANLYICTLVGVPTSIVLYVLYKIYSFMSQF